MDDDVRREALVRFLRQTGTDPDGAHELYHEDAVLEFPQSGERFVGRQAFSEWRKAYPAKVDFRIRRITGQGDLWLGEVLISYDDGPPLLGLNIVQFRDDRIAREIIYWMERSEAPDWRAGYATRFDPLASISVDDWKPGVLFGLEAEG